MLSFPHFPVLEMIFLKSHHDPVALKIKSSNFSLRHQFLLSLIELSSPKWNEFFWYTHETWKASSKGDGWWFPPFLSTLSMFLKWNWPWRFFTFLEVPKTLLFPLPCRVQWQNVCTQPSHPLVNFLCFLAWNKFNPQIRMHLQMCFQQHQPFQSPEQIFHL